MKSLRALLRLEDKVAAEWRRLELIGGPRMGSIAALSLVAAALLHAAVLLLPLTRSRAAQPVPSGPTDYPLVWRPAAAPVARLTPVPPPRPVPPPPVVPEHVVRNPLVDREERALVTEPVPEPAPELALATISAEIQAIIPDPDRPPPSPEMGPPAEPASDAVLAPIESVPPVYPLAARSIRAEGRVTLRLFVLPDGTVDRAVVEGCTRPGLGFEAAALAAVKRWRYEPAPLQSGARKVQVTVHFQRQSDRR